MSPGFRNILIHTCTVQRPTEAQSTSGEPIQTFAEQATEVECRLVMRLERYAAEDASRERTHEHVLLVRPTADIETGDRVTDFAWADGTAYNVGTYDVINVLRRNTRTAHHISCELEKVS